MCYVGKATKIFIFLITVLLITGIIMGFGVLRRTIHPKSHKCSGNSCSQSPLPPQELPFSSTPDPNASNPSDLTSPPLSPPPPPPPSGLSSNLSPPPTSPSLALPPSESSSNQTPPPPSPTSVAKTPPPPLVVIVAPPPGSDPVTPSLRFR